MSTTSAVRRLRSSVRAHPSVFLALKAAIAAMLAWLIVQPLGSPATDYAYYAPLGALTVVSTSVVTSVRSSFQVVLAILIGAAVALLAQLLPVPEPIPMGLAIVTGSLVGASGLVGGMSGWVPLAAMFVILVGRGDPVGYTAAYGGLTAAGAVVGVGINLVFPQLPLTPAARAQDRLRGQLADQLDELATALEREVIGETDWQELRRGLSRTARNAEDLVVRAREARRANWKAARWADTADRQDAQAQALHQLSGCVDDVMALVADQRAEIRKDEPAAAHLRATAAIALSQVAALLRGAVPPEEAHAAVSGLRSAVVQAQASTGDHHFAAAAITLDLEVAVEAWS